MHEDGRGEVHEDGIAAVAHTHKHTPYHPTPPYVPDYPSLGALNCRWTPRPGTVRTYVAFHSTLILFWVSGRAISCWRWRRPGVFELRTYVRAQARASGPGSRPPQKTRSESTCAGSGVTTGLGDIMMIYSVGAGVGAYSCLREVTVEVPDPGPEGHVPRQPAVRGGALFERSSRRCRCPFGVGAGVPLRRCRCGRCCCRWWRRCRWCRR